jgi:hypothetical protein
MCPTTIWPGKFRKPTNFSSCKVAMTMKQVKVFMSASSLVRREDARESHVTENRLDFY